MDATTTGDWALPTIDADRCSRCGACYVHCPTSAVAFDDDGMPVIVRPADCAYCGICEDLCPEGAVSLVYEVVPCRAPHRSGPTGPASGTCR
jgi:Pyruvate/2-oxoacid:ferredoxin oxidoreductase delta subunit